MSQINSNIKDDFQVVLLLSCFVGHPVLKQVSNWSNLEYQIRGYLSTRTTKCAIFRIGKQQTKEIKFAKFRFTLILVLELFNDFSY